MRYKNGFNSSIAHTFYVLAVPFLFCFHWFKRAATFGWYIYQNAWPNFAGNMVKLCLRILRYEPHIHYKRLWQTICEIYNHLNTLHLIGVVVAVCFSLCVGLHSLPLFASFVAPCLLQCWVKLCCCARMWVECASIRNFGFYFVCFVYNLYEYFRYICMDNVRDRLRVWVCAILALPRTYCAFGDESICIDKFATNE